MSKSDWWGKEESSDRDANRSSGLRIGSAAWVAKVAADKAERAAADAKAAAEAERVAANNAAVSKEMADALARRAAELAAAGNLDAAVAAVRARGISEDVCYAVASEMGIKFGVLCDAVGI